MRKTLPGFSFFEVILYVGLFSLMATMLLHFSWDIIDLGVKDKTKRQVSSDARSASVRINTFIRNAAGIDTGASAFDTADGQIVLTTLGSSDTVTINIENDQLMLHESGTSTKLHSSDSKVESLTFSQSGTQTDSSEYVGYTLVLVSTQNGTAVRSQYEATITIQSGAFIRNSGL